VNTKESIINTAITLFNAHGYGSVSMKQIADRIGVDRRNITYHFNKEVLLLTIAERMWSELEEMRAQKRDFPSFENLDKEVILYNRLQQTYAFIFRDLYVMEHPQIASRFKSFCSTIIADSEKAVSFAIQQGNMRPEEIKGAYHGLCEAVWTISMSWLQLKAFRDIDDLDQVRKLIWSLIVPYFTEKGIKAFQSYFGKDFYKNLGKPFDIKVNTVLF